MPKLEISSKAKAFFDLTDEEIKILKRLKFVKLDHSTGKNVSLGYCSDEIITRYHLHGSANSPTLLTSYENSEDGKRVLKEYLKIINHLY